MPPEVKYNDVLCIGLGFSGICVAIQLKKQFGHDDMHFYDRNESHSGTWWSNHYPGAACDVPAALYSFSFEQNPGWTRLLPTYDEIRAYIEGVVDKHQLRRYMTFRSECESAHWDSARHVWSVKIRNLDSGKVFVHECRVLFSAVGQLVEPLDPKIPGSQSFKGHMFHTSRWRDDVDLTGKNVVVIGNGCSASQLVPQIVNKAKTVVQFFRTPHWLLYLENPERSPRQLWVLKHTPLLNRLLRLAIFLYGESNWRYFYMNAYGAWLRKGLEKTSKDYIRQTAPEKYQEILIPDYPIACKRRIFDANALYLKSLHSPNLLLTKDPIVEIGPEGVKAADKWYPADVIVLSTGFETNKGLGPLRVQGRNGEWLHDHWANVGGLSAYNSTSVHGFPNFFMFYGPNSNQGHSSVITTVENSVNYALAILKPIFKGEAVAVEVKKEADEKYTEIVQKVSKTRVFSACHNWYVTKEGWNGVNYPWSQMYFWWRSTFPIRDDWDYEVIG
ncbi:4-hydroxyacetophenone monooxygenase [Hysterangium stoloniferum]|nr:4-hydroxyacetophenone monooxygenase [Hysterangium stoloniferum]